MERRDTKLMGFKVWFPPPTPLPCLSSVSLASPSDSCKSFPWRQVSSPATPRGSAISFASRRLLEKSSFWCVCVWECVYVYVCVVCAVYMCICVCLLYVMCMCIHVWVGELCMYVACIYLCACIFVCVVWIYLYMLYAYVCILHVYICVLYVLCV